MPLAEPGREKQKSSDPHSAFLRLYQLSISINCKMSGAKTFQVRNDGNSSKKINESNKQQTKYTFIQKKYDTHTN